MAQTETKTYLINFQDNLDAYAQHAADARKEVDKLTKENQELLASGEATQVQIEKSNAALRAAQQEYKNAQKNVELATKANAANKDSYEELYRRWKLAETQLKLMGDGYEINEKGVRVLSQAYIQQSKVVASARKDLNEFNLGVKNGSLNVGLYGDALQAALGPAGGLFSRAAGGVKSLSNAFKVLLANPIVAILAAIVAVLMTLYKAFTSTDKGATEFAARFEQLKAILDVVRQRVVALFGAIQALFKGDFKEAAAQAKAAVSGVGDQLKEATKAAYEYQYALDAITDAENNYVSQAAETRNAIAKLEYTAQDRTRSVAERRKALQDAIALSTQEAETYTTLAKRKLDAELDYLAGKSKVRAADILGFIRMTDAEQENASESLKTLRNNNEAKFTELEKLYAAYIDADTKFFEDNKKNLARITSFELELRQQAAEARKKAIIEQKRQEAEAATAALRNELDRIGKETEARAAAQVTLREKQETLYDEILARRLEKIRLEAEASDALLQETVLGRLELERRALDEEYKLKIAAAQRVNADTTDIEQAYSDARVEIANIERDAKLNVAQGIANAVLELTGEQSAIGKFAAVAATTIDTYRGAQAAFTGMTSTIPGPAGIAAGVAAAALAVAIGLANVKKILSVKTPKAGGGGGGGAAATAGGAMTMGGTTLAGAAQRVTAQPVGATALNTGTQASNVAAQQQGAEITAEAMAKALAAMPAPKVTVEDINAKTTEVNKVKTVATV